MGYGSLRSLKIVPIIYVLLLVCQLILHHFRVIWRWKHASWLFLQVTRGHWKWHHSIDRISYSPSLVMAISCIVFHIRRDIGWKTPIFSQPSIYIDGWLYGMSMTSVVCNVPVLSQNDSTYHHSVFRTWKWHPFATWTPSFIILVWGHHPLIGATVFPASRTLVKRRTVTP